MPRHTNTFNILYMEKLNWVIPFPGDFHMLSNYQEVLMRIYWDAGLKDIAGESGYRLQRRNSDSTRKVL